MKYSVADISVPLDSISQICDAVASVTFNADGGWIELPDKERLVFHREGDTYCRKMWVDREPQSTPFNRQGHQSS